MSSISATQLNDRLEGGHPPALLDVRRMEEFALVNLPGARLIPLHELPARLDELDDWKDREVVVYCHHGIRSRQAIGFLEQSGFVSLVNLTGGIDAWSLDVDPSLPRY